MLIRTTRPVAPRDPSSSLVELGRSWVCEGDTSMTGRCAVADGSPTRLWPKTDRAGLPLSKR